MFLRQHYTLKDGLERLSVQKLIYQNCLSLLTLYILVCVLVNHAFYVVYSLLSIYLHFAAVSDLFMHKHWDGLWPSGLRNIISLFNVSNKNGLIVVKVLTLGY